MTQHLTDKGAHVLQPGSPTMPQASITVPLDFVPVKNSLVNGSVPILYLTELLLSGTLYLLCPLFVLHMSIQVSIIS